MNIGLSIPFLLIVVSLVFCQNDKKNATRNETETTTQINTHSTLPPSETICNQINTCQQYNKINEPKYEDLRTRKCMCDEKCPMYKDCCKDSIYHNTSTEYNVSFSCKSTFFNGYIYMVDKCTPDYNNSKIIENCHTANRKTLVQNVLLTIPVTNTLTNITYKNAFCALCNNEVKFEFWQPVLHYQLEKQEALKIITQNTSEPSPLDKNTYYTDPGQSILTNMKVDENRAKLVALVNGLSYICNIVPNITGNIAPAVRFCLSNSNDRLCSDCEKGISTNSCIENFVINYNQISVLRLDLDNPNLPKIDTCNDIPANVDNKNVFCKVKHVKNESSTEPSTKSSDESSTALADIDSCFFVTGDNRPCLVNTEYGPSEYKILENGSIYIEEYPFAFPREQYIDYMDDSKQIYLCGTEIPRTDEEKSHLKLGRTLTGIFSKISIFFLILYLITNVNKQKLQSLPNKILLSFCLTLLIFYVVILLPLEPPNCKIAAALTHYLYLSFFMWLLIASYDFWQVICRSSTKLQTLAGKTRLKRYLIYCFFGWISPLSIMAVAIYFERAPNITIPCYLKPGYGRLNCFIAQRLPKRYFYLYPATIILCTIVALFAHTSYHIYLSKRKNIKSTAQNNYYMLFLKLALTMGLTWTLGLLVTYTDIYFIDNLYNIVNTSYGSLMYFAYGFECTMLTKMYEKHKNNAIVQQTKSTFVSITDRIKSSSSQPSTSADPPTQEMESTH